ncbi:MAG: glutamine synthetase III [Oscillospiraceae bacterium]|nr:glutamine synthetase III [Oscillospiraceae bacterium]
MDFTELFGSLVFNDDAMRRKLPRDVYSALRETQENGTPLDPALADAVARGMRDWAMELGATHYTHWFQPMTGVTAEKHDAFMDALPGGAMLANFSGKALIRSEQDASSFPSGGLRATFEARGYTAWDPTSYAFIKDNTLCIPTAFCSFGGEVLDKKTPLLRSMQALDVQGKRILKLFGTKVKRVFPTVGAEQEYFIVDREKYNKRKDLIYTGRTLFGARPPKGQELDDHYFGSLKQRIAAYMRELDENLWKLGVYAKTEHNEAAPAQHELAPIHQVMNVACDHNQIMMEQMRKVAKRHGLTCLLHEKPFAGINGSGKHLNWSLSTDTGANLLDPGETPEDNAKFLLFLCAVIKAVDDYPELLRISVATSANDHRLGALEAPPAIVSLFIGDELEDILAAVEAGEHYDRKESGLINVGVDTLPALRKDTTDRNRTSPFAFTGNKFEFRMPGSSASIGEPATVLNTIVAEALSCFADELEAAEDMHAALQSLLSRTIKNHKRVLFNGNGYGEEWLREAERRGLPNLRTAADALPHMLDEKNVAVLTKHGIYTEKELHSRCEIMLETYSKTILIEARTMLEMARTDILPEVLRYTSFLAQSICSKKASGVAAVCKAETALLEQLSLLCDEMYDRISALEQVIADESTIEGCRAKADFCRDTVLGAMDALRAVSDRMEPCVAGKYWPIPSYGSLLYRV